MQGFLDELRIALMGNMPGSQMESHIAYYEEYFLKEKSKGRSEQDILDELGDPRLIAKTLIETSGGERVGKTYVDVDEDGRKGGRSFGSAGDGIKGFLTLAIVLVLVIVGIVLIVRTVFFFVPVILALIVIAIIVSYFKGRK